MFSIFKKKPADEDLRKVLFDFLAEMEKNLEYFYVMDQRQFITHGFLMECWPQVRALPLIQGHASILAYARSLEDFNASLKAYKDYEQWYTSHVDHKNPENARKLHAMKNGLDVKLKTLEEVIIPAGQDLEKEMIKLGWIKA